MGLLGCPSQGGLDTRGQRRGKGTVGPCAVAVAQGSTEVAPLEFLQRVTFLGRQVGPCPAKPLTSEGTEREEPSL